MPTLALALLLAAAPAQPAAKRLVLPRAHLVVGFVLTGAPLDVAGAQKALEPHVAKRVAP